MARAGGTDRGQSETIGYILLVGIAAIGMTGIVVFGSAAVEDSRHAMEVGSAEHAMTEFDSQASLVAHGDSSTQHATLPAGRGQQISVRQDAGWMNITIRNETTDAVKQQIMNKSLGAIVYENGPTTIAYQGGGVWQAEGGRVKMVSPPEVHYQGSTLTLPLVLVQGDGTVSGQVQVSQSGTVTAEYPTASRQNPLEEGLVVVEVHSDYYDGWGRYFEQRTEGEAVLRHDSDVARINLTIPFQEDFQSVVATTASDGIDVNGGDPPTPYQTGVNYPSVDDTVEDEVSACESGGCNETRPTTVSSPGTYYWDGDHTSGLTVDSPGGNVSVVVNGDFEPGLVTVENVAAENDVSVYVRQDFTIGNDVNEIDGEPSELRVLVHSDGDVNLNGNNRFSGFIYAPGSACDMNGNAVVTGGVVCETMQINGDPNDFAYDDSVRDIDLGLNEGDTTLTYLHVSTTAITVSSS